MVSFVEVGPPWVPGDESPPTPAGGPPEEDHRDEQLRLLQQENDRLREDLRTLVQEYEAANEELQSTNEELQSANKRFTPAMKSIMDLLPSDVGREVGHFAVHLQYDRLAADATEVLRTLNSLSREVQGEAGTWFQLRIMPYRTRQNVIDGVVVTFHDVTDLKRSEQASRITQAVAEGVVDAIREPVLLLDGELRVESANRAFYRTFRVSREETQRAHVYELGDRQWDIPRLRELLEEVIPERGEVSGFEVEHDFPHLGPRRMVLSARRIEVEGTPPKILLAIGERTEPGGSGRSEKGTHDAGA